MGQPLLRLGQFSLCYNSLGRLTDNAEDALDLSRLVVNRRVRDVEINALRVAVPLDVEGAVLGEHGFSSIQYRPRGAVRALVLV